MEADVTAVKRRAEEDGERKEKKGKGEPKERGTKRSLEDWDDYKKDQEPNRAESSAVR